MSVDIGKSFRDGLQGMASPRGLVVGLLLLVMAIANLYVTQSISLRVQEWLFGFLGDGAAQQQAMAQAGTNLPFALDLGIPLLLVLTAVFLLVNELIRLVGIRLFGSESNQPLPLDDVSENFGSAALKALVLGGIVSLVALIPIVGLVLALLFVYLRQVIALEELGWGETLSRSFNLFMEDPVPITVVLLVLGVLNFVVVTGVSFAFNVAMGGPGATAGNSILGNVQALGTLVGTALAVLFQVLGIAVVTDAYEQVRASADEPAV